MLNYIALYPNEKESELNIDFLDSKYDKSLDDYVIACMMDFESVENIQILDYKIIRDQDEVDLNYHMININYKKKNMDDIQIPKYDYIMDSRYHEIVFRIRVSTNLNEKIIEKRILVPTEHNGYYLINGKKMKVIWQLVDASTYSQRGRTTMKSRMPTIMYHNKHKLTPDVNGTEFVLPNYMYAQDTSKKRRGRAANTGKKKMKFVNPLMIFSAKLGFTKTISFFGMDGIVTVKKTYTKKDEKANYVFQCNDVYLIVNKELFDHFDMVKLFICMAAHLGNRDFPVTMDVLDDTEYWTCRLGYLGNIKNKNLHTFYDKGRTAIHMIERLADPITTSTFRLPELYKSNIYYIMYWMITNFDALKQRVNIDMANKRIRKNEALVLATLGRKISENINKLIDKKTRSKLNTIDTLLEMFNFSSDILMTGMTIMNDMVKSGDTSNDMAFLSDMAYTAKGPNSLGENSSKAISEKYLHLHPSMVGVLDLFTTSNSDPGMSGSIVPFVKLYDKFFFTEDGEPCQARYLFEKELKEEFHIDRKLPLDTFEEYIEYITKKNQFSDQLKYLPIKIVEKEEEDVEIPNTD